MPALLVTSVGPVPSPPTNSEAHRLISYEVKLCKPPDRITVFAEPAESDKAGLRLHLSLPAGAPSFRQLH